jgi:glycosyltransferase involved in cell wall biosynthesis/SAM-dependent methyltransferase
MRIPYIVEYNGSEIAIQRGMNTAPVYADLYVKTEEFAFRQATAISVVSEHIKDDLVNRGIDARKILVNPNGADVDQYAPPAAQEKREVRRALGFADDECVIGFTGTFGWWHGIDVLSAAIPRICAELPRARFLLIGDGDLKHELDAEVERHGLQARVTRVGAVPQAQGARLLKACDMYVSPHSRHMVNGRFFGSPTKVFEYMAMGSGIVASDLEQIGEVLSPAIRARALAGGEVRVTSERAVLSTPGDVDEFVAGVVGLARRPDVGCALGRNARCAVSAHYSWRRHVERLWAFIDQLPQESGADAAAGARVAQPHTREWFVEIERDRYARAPWLQAAIDGASQAGQRVLEIGTGPGTDSARFAGRGADVTGIDTSGENVLLASRNFAARGLKGTFVEWDGRLLPFDDNTFDLVYSHRLDDAPSAAGVVAEISRVLRPGGAALVVLGSERSLGYWRDSVWKQAVRTGDISRQSIGSILARTLPPDDRGRSAVQVFTPRAARTLFRGFADVRIEQRGVSPDLLPERLRRHSPAIERYAGDHLVIRCRKPS